MTTRIAPDYHLELELPLKEFQAIRGTAFAVEVVYEEDKHVNGELIIPEFNDFPERSPLAKAWLWLNELVRLGPGTDIKAILREPSEYRITEKEYNNLMTYQGLAIKGLVSINT